MGPLFRAPSVAGAVRVDASGFRALEAQSSLIRTLVGRDYQVWSLRGRRARDWKQRHGWRLWDRLDPDASGDMPQCIYQLDVTPPEIRKAGFREVMEALRCKGQVSYPPSVATDAQVGFSAMANRSVGLLPDRCEGSGHILVRLEGTCTRAQKAGKETEMTRRAKVGNCPCCTDPTHNAAPSRHEVGEYSPHKARGVSPWKEHGPWAARFFAASLYAQGWAHLPSAWDRAAQYPKMRAPPLFGGTFGSLRAPTSAVSPPCTQGEVGKNPM